MDTTCKNFIFILVIMVLSFSCKKSIVDSGQMQTFIEKPKNGLIKTSEKEYLNVEVQYRPSDMVVEQHLNSLTSFNDSLVDSLRAIYNQNLYFILRMSYKNQELLSALSGNSQRFSEMVNRLAFEMANYVSLVSDVQDTLQLIDFIYPRMYGMSVSSDIMFVFERKISPAATKLNFNIDEFGLDCGEMRFGFDVKDLKRIPKLRIKRINKEHIINSER